MQSTELLERWHLNLTQVRERMDEAERPRERECWRATGLRAAYRTLHRSVDGDLMWHSL